MQSTLTVVILIFASLNFCGFSKNHCNLWLIILSIKYFFRNISCQSFNEHLIFKFVDSTALSMNIVIQPILMKLKYYIFHNISNDGVMTQVFIPCDCWENSLGSINDKLPDFLIYSQTQCSYRYISNLPKHQLALISNISKDILIIITLLYKLIKNFCG